MLLRTTAFEVEFSGAIHNLSIIRNLTTGDNYVKKVPRVPLVSLSALTTGSDSLLELLPDTARISGDEAQQTVDYQTFGGYAIQVTVHLKACGDSLFISADIANHQEGLDIVEILCPHISGIYLGDSYQDDTIIYPHHAGEKTLDPVRMYGVEGKRFWRASSEPFGDIYRREINYCGLASMSWMYYYDDANALYIGSHDPRFPVTGVIAETGTEKDPYMGFCFRKHHRIRPGDSYGTGEYRIVVSDKDWHYGSRIYRDYIAGYLDFNHTPQFLRQECALNQCYNFKRRGQIEHRFQDIPAMFEEGLQWGVRHMFIASWNRTGFDSFYPEYYPDMELGSAMEFRRGLEYVRSRGGFTTLYINARIFDVESNFHATLGERMALRDYKGQMCRETYGPQHFTVNCPGDRLWQDYLVDTAEFAVKAYGADGIYLDQLASAEPLACYSGEHSHADIGDFNNGNLYILKELLRRLREHNPNAYLMTENCGDIYGSYTWSNLTWNGADYDEFYQVFSYTFPEFTQVNMVNPRSWEPDPDKRNALFRSDIQRAVLLGNIFWMGLTSRFKTDAVELRPYARQALEFRRHIQEYLSIARFVDDAYITDITEGCAATCWELQDGRYLVLCGNPENAVVASLGLQLPLRCSGYTRYDLAWHTQAFSEPAENFRLDFGGERLVGLLFQPV